MLYLYDCVREKYTLKLQLSTLNLVPYMCAYLSSNSNPALVQHSNGVLVALAHFA